MLVSLRPALQSLTKKGSFIAISSQPTSGLKKIRSHQDSRLGWLWPQSPFKNLQRSGHRYTRLSVTEQARSNRLMTVPTYTAWECSLRVLHRSLPVTISLFRPTVNHRPTTKADSDTNRQIPIPLCELITACQERTSFEAEIGI